RQEGIEPSAVEAVVVASVVPPLNSSLVQAIERYFGKDPMMVGPGIKTGLKIHYRDPKEVGADRIVAAMAAFKKYGGPLIIFDFTAQVEGMVARIRKELGENPRVIATGGYAGLIAAETPVIEVVDQRLMLEGLRLIYEMNA